MHYAGVHRTPIMYVVRRTYNMPLRSTPYGRAYIIDVPRMPYGHAVQSIRTALRAVLSMGVLISHPILVACP